VKLDVSSLYELLTGTEQHLYIQEGSADYQTFPAFLRAAENQRLERRGDGNLNSGT
jgi:hypothetical protein